MIHKRLAIKRITISLAEMLVAAAAIASFLYIENEPHEAVLPDRIDCLMELKAYDDTTKGLITGYNYHLLKQYARQTGKEVDIRLTTREEFALDSLRYGLANLVIIPFEDSLDIEKAQVSIPVDSLTFWVVEDHQKDWLEDINAWIDAYHNSEEYGSVREKFLKTYDPFRRRSGQQFISPYDDIVKACADSIHWDWRLLSAIIYQESHFRIDARSRRGASGLMQMMPATAKRMGVTSLLDPEQSIRAGASYIRTIEKHFRDIADPKERKKFTLAGYNAGESRIRECLEFAKGDGLEIKTWEDMVDAILLIRETGYFNGSETIAYVDRVMLLYQEFCRICPE